MIDCLRHNPIDVKEKRLEPQDDCTVMAVYDPEDNAFDYTYASLLDLINRGRDSSGISGMSLDGIVTQKGLGTPDKVPFVSHSTRMAIGHDRYTTQSETTATNAQPFQVISADGKWEAAVSHNGNVEVSFESLIQNLPEGNTDSALMAQLIVEAPGSNWPLKIRNAAKHFNGSYSSTMLTADDGMYGFCDPRKNRDLWLGWNDDGVVALSSETFPFEHGAFAGKNMQFRPVGAGELVHITKDGNVETEQMLVPLEEALCLIEPIYLQKGESRSSKEGFQKNNLLRFSAGEMLAKEEKYLQEIDPSKIAVVSIPNGGDMYSKGYANGIGAKSYRLLEKVLDSRSFMAQNGDHSTVAKQKMAINYDEIRRMIDDGITDMAIIDDSLIRGSQSEPTMELIYNALNEYRDQFMQIPNRHLRLGSPQFKHPCGLGIAITDEAELFYNRVKDPLKKLNLSSIQHLSLPGMLEAFTGKTPTAIVGLVPIGMGYCFSCMWPDKEWKNPVDWYQEEELQDVIYSSRKGSIQVVGNIL